MNGKNHPCHHHVDLVLVYNHYADKRTDRIVDAMQRAG